MTAFDFCAATLVFLSAFAGFSRGGVHELVGLFAFTLAALGTIALLPFTAPLVRHFIHSGWIAAVLGALTAFAAIFILLRLTASLVTNTLDQATVLGAANRIFGLIFGAVRGVVLIALFALVFNRVTPGDLKPGWITAALSYPTANAAGSMLQQLLPKGLSLAGGVSPAVIRAVEAQSGADADPPDRARQQPVQGGRRHSQRSDRANGEEHGYTQRARDSVDALVERAN